MKGVVVGDGAVGKARRLHSPDSITYERLKTDMSSYFLYDQCLPCMSRANFPPLFNILTPLLQGEYIPTGKPIFICAS